MQHRSLGIALPVFSIETADHTGGGYHVGGLHPSSIAAMTGKGPEVKKGEQFDLKFNVNAKRTSLALVVDTQNICHIWSGVRKVEWVRLLVPKLRGYEACYQRSSD